jgi:hypothetical protein
VVILPIQPRGEADLPTDPRHNAQMVQPFGHIPS